MMMMIKLNKKYFYFSLVYTDQQNIIIHMIYQSVWSVILFDNSLIIVDRGR